MCGIAGILDPSHQVQGSELESHVLRMTNAIAYRGPDDEGAWSDREAGVCLGHRRLSILDLSSEGHQPMRSESGRYVITYNGEVYNFADLGRQLEGLGHRFRGHSDTEVILAAMSQWGVEGAVGHFNGMFAFAVWDRQDRILWLARDRIGEKPLYYGCVGKALVFASELKAIRAFPGFAGDIDRDVLSLYFRHSSIPSPYSVYRGISKLAPGTVLAVRPDRLPELSTPAAYWSARDVAQRGTAHPLKGAPLAIVDRLEALLRDAVKIRMQSDVPLGAFLSGGVDSSTVVALMQAQSERPIKTFSIGTVDPRLDEAHSARQIARHLGTDHTEHYVTPEEAMAVIPRLPAIYDEPFADSSQIPTHLVSALARKQVTVSLSGDGGDELFAGYHRHFKKFWQKVHAVPRPLRHAAAAGLQAATSQDAGSDRLWRASLSRVRSKLYKASLVLDADRVEGMYANLVSHWLRPSELVLGASEPPTTITDPGRWADVSNPTQRIMYLDLVTYLPDDILVKLDRASMAVSLESRVPFLDPRVIELAWQIPVELDLRHPFGKWPLREVLARYVPRSLTERPKRGFGIPLLAWLRGPMRPWAESLLTRDRLHRDGLLNAGLVRRVWAACLSGAAEWEHAVWEVLMFQAWLDEVRRVAPESHAPPPSVGRRAPLRVLHVFGRMDRGGAEMRTLDVIRGLDRSRFQFDFATLSGLPGSLDEEARALGATIHPCRFGPGFIGRFRKILRQGHYDVVHSHVHHSSGLVLRLAASEEVPVRIAHFRNTRDRHPDGPQRKLQRLLMKHWLDQCATQILAVCDGAMRAAWSPEWESDPRCRVIYNGIDPALFANAPAGAREELGIAPDAPLFVHIGSLNQSKNHRRLLEIFAAVLVRRPDARLLIIGRDIDGMEKCVRRWARELGVEGSTLILGERTDVPRLLQAADIELFPSLWEGLPGAVLEACAAGVPVLGSDIPGMREIARHLASVRLLSLAALNEEWASAALELLREYPRATRSRTTSAFAESPFVLSRAVAQNLALLERASASARA